MAIATVRAGDAPVSGWTGPADIRAAVQREWDTGRLLGTRIPGDHPGTAFPLRVRIRRPSQAELGQRFDDVRRWAAQLSRESGYRLESAPVQHRTLGRQVLPTAAWIDGADAALRLIGRTRDAAVFDRLVAATPAEFLGYVAARPLAVLAVADDWPSIVTVAEWLLAHPHPGTYLRQVDLPGVHTKVIERHKKMIAALVDTVAPSQPGASGRRWFEQRYGFRTKAAMVRFRPLDRRTAPLPGLTDVTLPVAEFAALPVPGVQRVFVTENEINFLAFPDAECSLVVFGDGNEAPETLGAVQWLHGLDVHYWGDIDTHGFAILDRLRTRLPHAASLLMDMGTLLDHRSSWGLEETQVRRDLPTLTDAEAAVYAELCAGSLGDRVRLEQEFIRFSAVRDAVAAAVPPKPLRQLRDWRDQ